MPTISGDKKEVARKYERHIFLCHKKTANWNFCTAVDPLPDLFEDAIVARGRKGDIPLNMKLTIFDGGDECTDGDVLLFPEMTKHKGLEVANVDSFVEDVLVNGKPWGSRVHEVLSGFYIFVCLYPLHKTCVVCGPLVIEAFKEKFDSRKLKHQSFIYPCFNIGEHEVGGNVIIFRSTSNGNVFGNCFGYVSPYDVDELFFQHIAKGLIVRRLWRGGMTPYFQDANGDSSSNNEVSEGIQMEKPKPALKVDGKLTMSLTMILGAAALCTMGVFLVCVSNRVKYEARH